MAQVDSGMSLHLALETRSLEWIGKLVGGPASILEWGLRQWESPSPDSRGSTEDLALAAHLPPRRDLTSPRLIGLGLARGYGSPGTRRDRIPERMRAVRAARGPPLIHLPNATGTLPDLRAKSVNEDLDIGTSDRALACFIAAARRVQRAQVCGMLIASVSSAVSGVRCSWSAYVCLSKARLWRGTQARTERGTGLLVGGCVKAEMTVGDAPAGSYRDLHYSLLTVSCQLLASTIKAGRDKAGQIELIRFKTAFTQPALQYIPFSCKRHVRRSLVDVKPPIVPWPSPKSTTPGPFRIGFEPVS
ncbi:hypothetical protein VE02_09459 [Pseudogymnoascus sp. 03VT05]|nr:hypothetical protein VE02_09459 [Pseudogymnoascus sp. 03VT05]